MRLEEGEKSLRRRYLLDAPSQSPLLTFTDTASWLEQGLPTSGAQVFVALMLHFYDLCMLSVPQDSDMDPFVYSHSLGYFIHSPKDIINLRLTFLAAT